MSDIWRDYFLSSILFNVKILPESLVSGIAVLSVLLANQPLFAIALGAIVTQFLVYMIGTVIIKHDSANARVVPSIEACSAGYVGRAWDRILRGTVPADLLWHSMSPSMYLSTIGFFAGWGWALQQLYKDEVAAGILNRSTFITMSIITCLLLILVVIFRVMSGCETLFGAVSGLVLGLLFGYFMSIGLGYSSDRRLTNVWGIPLLRDRINDGAPVYICPS